MAETTETAKTFEEQCEALDLNTVCGGAAHAFRTFPDIEQPESPFILRLRTGQSGAPEFSLHECDGGAWQLRATQDIVRLLQDSVRDVARVYG